MLHKVSISFEQHLQQLFQWELQSKTELVTPAPDCSSGCESSICQGTAQTWLQLKGGGALDVQHLRPFFKTLITHGRWDECKDDHHSS